MGTISPFFYSPRFSADCHGLSNFMESDSATTSTSSLRTLGCILLGPIDIYIQVSHVVTNLVFCYSGRDFALQFVP